MSNLIGRSRGATQQQQQQHENVQVVMTPSSTRHKIKWKQIYYRQKAGDERNNTKYFYYSRISISIT